MTVLRVTDARKSFGPTMALDGASLALWLSFGAWPVLMAAAAWAAMLGLGRRTLGAARIRAEGSLDAIAAAAMGLGILGESVFLLAWAVGLNKPFNP